MRFQLRRRPVTRSRSQAHAERSRATRIRIIDAATPLFMRDGYLETTMSGIARAAGVAVQTLYLSFGSKVAVFEAALGAAADHDGPAPIVHPPHASTDGPTALAAHVRSSAAAVAPYSRGAGVGGGAAADPEPAQLLDRTRHAALAAHSRVVDELAERPGFTHRISLQRATEIVATMLSPETYGLMVVTHGWTPQDWCEWAIEHLTVDLYPHPADSQAMINA
jgi:AcrR family transcriptional regulator